MLKRRSPPAHIGGRPHNDQGAEDDKLYAPLRAPSQEWATYIRQHMNDEMYGTLVASKLP